MVNKKYLLLAGLCSAFLGQPAFAQESGSATTAQWSSRDMTYRGQSYDVLDSSYYPKGRLDQYRRYMNHQEAFPPKPRSMWEVGVGGGLYNIIGDVPTLFLWNNGGYGFHAHVRKAWGYFLSTRLQYNYGIAKGLDHDLASPGYVNKEEAWNGTNNGYSYTAAGQFVGRNHRTEMHQLNLDFMGSINNINFHKARIKMSLYGFVGLGVRAYKVRVNALDVNMAPYTGLLEEVGPNPDRETVVSVLESRYDDSYETDGLAPDIDDDRTTMFDNKPIGFAPSLGAGAQFRLSKRINLAIEDRYSFGAGDDLLDGHRWSGDALTPAWDGSNYFSLGLNFNLGNSRRSVEPLYWLNPLDHAYNELSYPRHMVLPDPVLPDADGDGVTDQFDKCPGTPAGVAVDAHGCPMDTDGDGVPDDRDKELITPTYCQPVDADGVGKCPCPEGCGTASTCANIGAGSITFDNNSSTIRSSAQAQMATLAAQMQANPTCKVVITGSGNASKIQQQRSWDRVNRIIEYMSEKHGIDRNRFIFQYGQAGDANSVMYRSAMSGEEGPANVAPPFPNLRRD
jgi:hypothetical protein